MKQLSVILTFLLLSCYVHASDFVVNSLADGPGEPGPTTQTLRWAIAEANGDASATPLEPHIIRFTVAGTITLTSQLPSLSTHISIVGPVEGITLLAKSGFRALGTPAGNTITLSNLTITGGGGLGLGGGVLNNSSNMSLINCTIYGNTATQRGGGIYSRNLGGANPVPELHLINCKIYGNTSTGTAVGNGGGGIYADGPLTIENSQIYQNSSQGPTNGGGGIYAISSVSIRNSSVNENRALRGGGGGIYVAGAFTISNTILEGNTASSTGGGAIYKTGGGQSVLTALTVRNNTTTTNAGTHGAGMFFNSTGSVSIKNSVIHHNKALGISSGGGGIRIGNSAQVTITNSTIYGNTCTGAGGGLSHAGTGKLTVNQSTVVANNGEVGGGIWGNSTADSWLNYTIVSGNSSPNGLDLSGNFKSEHQYNRLGSTLGYTWLTPNATNTTGNSALLLFGTSSPVLADNGATEGVTQTVALASGVNPAVLTDAEVIASLTGVEPTDQRGFLRNNSASRSIGAFERDAQAFYLANIEAGALLFVIPGSSRVAVSNTLVASADGLVTQAAVQVTAGYIAGKDKLTATQLPTGIIADWNAETGILSLSGNASPLAYQNALRNVAYENLNSLEPGFGNRTISFTLSKGGTTSNTLSRIIVVTPPPPPSISNLETGVLEYVIGCNGFVSYRITASGTISAFGLNSLTVQITGNYQPGGDQLAALQVPLGMTAQFDPNAAGGGKLTLSGNFPGSVYQQVLRNIVFSSSMATPDLSVRTITIRISDGFNPADADQDTRSRQVQPVTPASVAYAGKNVVYPSDAVVNILCYRPDLNQGIVDATPYIMQAIAEHTRDPYLAVKRKILYFPNGTYKLKDGVFVDNLNATFTGNGNGKGIIFQGQSKEHTILKLTDNNPNFQNTSNPKPVLSNSRSDFQPGSFVNVAFKQGVFDLTIDIGSGNPGASGLRFIANNQGSVRDVFIKSGDGQGWAGLDMEQARIPGPALIKHVTIEGFDYGIRIASPNYSMVMEHITITGSRLGGILNTDNVLSIRKLKTSGIGGPAIISRTANSMITLLDSELHGMGSGSAIVNEEGYAFVRNVSVSGFGSSITSHGEILSGNITEFVQGAVLKKWEDSPDRTLNLKNGNIPDAPEVPWDLPENWVDVCAFAGGYTPGVDAPNPQDIGPAIRAAIQYMNQPGNESKTTLYLRPGIYTIATPVTIYGNVRRYAGNYAAMFTTVELENQTTALFTIESTNYPALVLEGISLPLPLSWPAGVDRRKKFPLFENNSDKDVVIQNVMCHTGKIYRTGSATGRIFIEDVKGGNHSNVAPEPLKTSLPPEATPQFEFRNQEVYARQFNPEQIETKVLVDGGSLYVLGLKTEKSGTLIKVINGAEVEILGGQSIAADNVAPEIAAFEVIDSKANFIFSEQVSASAFTNQLYFKRMVAETRGGETRFLEREETPKRLVSANTPVSVLNLYVARPKDAQAIQLDAIADKLLTDPAVVLTATASSGLQVTYTLVNTLPSVATLDNGIITLVGAGEVTVRASQAGDANYAAAPDVETSFRINKLTQSITFAQLADVTYQSTPLLNFALMATASSGLAVTLELVSGPASLSDNMLTITGIGLVTIKASQGGSQLYLPAGDVIQTFAVTSTDKSKGIKPLVESVTDNGNGEWIARFGYKNDMDMPVYIPVGPGNYLAPATAAMSQPENFQPQRVMNAFSVIIAAGAQVSWSVAGPDGKLRTATAVAGVQQVAARVGAAAEETYRELRLYPNPSEGDLIIEWKLEEKPGAATVVTLYNLMGQAVFRKHITGSRHTLDLASLPAGLYHLHLSNGHHSITKPFIKK